MNETVSRSRPPPSMWTPFSPSSYSTHLSTKNGEWLKKTVPSFLPLVIWEKTALITTCKSVIDVSQLLLDSAWVGLFLANQPDTSVFLFLFFFPPSWTQGFQCSWWQCVWAARDLIAWVYWSKKEIWVTVRISGVLSCFCFLFCNIFSFPRCRPITGF